MIKFEKTKVFNFEGAIRGMRNPLDSWDMSDSTFCSDRFDCDGCSFCADRYEAVVGNDPYILGANDLDLARRLIKAGSDHRKFLRQIFVSVDITAPLYWWKEFDTYKIATVANSCSTMHKIHAKEIELSDFSFDDFDFDDSGLSLKDLFINVVSDCESLRRGFLTYNKKARDAEHFTEAERKHFRAVAKMYWRGLIQLLPESYNQKRTVTLNYETLRNIRGSRKGHKLDEWRVGFMEWIDSLPYAEDLIIN